MEHKKTLVVTGGSRGIGRAIAIELAAQGNRIVVGYRTNKAAADDVAREISDRGGDSITLPIDLSSNESIRGFFAKIIEISGGIDVLVNNAGINLRAPAVETTEQMFDDLFRVNVRGLFFCCIEATKLMLKHNTAAEDPHGGIPIKGRIINVSAVTGRTVPPPGMTIYGATKAAVDSLTRSLAAELGPQGILVNAVAPGVTETDIAKSDDPATVESLRRASVLKRIGRPDDIAKIVSFLATDAWIVGQSINASGGRLL